MTTLALGWYCSGVRQFRIGTVVVGGSMSFAGHLDWLSEAGIHVVDLRSAECFELMRDFIRNSPEIWNKASANREICAMPRPHRCAETTRSNGRSTWRPVSGTPRS